MKKFIDNTFLKTSLELDISEEDLKEKIQVFIKESVQMDFKCVVVRSEYLNLAFNIKSKFKSTIKIATVVNFPLGTDSFDSIIKQLNKSKDFADEIDIVVDYNAFKYSDFKRFDSVIELCTNFCLENDKIVKWIIETGALSKNEIKSICQRIEAIISSQFSNHLSKSYIKTSTGYYSGYGAKLDDIKLIKNSIKKMKIKASGGIKSKDFAEKLVKLGCDRIGTSSGKDILK
ncbi:deoxyribose-phosphate aldolase [Bacteroidota bacterium]|nr:deoxyribose-phosphate aldolase [Bacteroidota bacterium]MDC3230195.1 deoxyribose-phosphate aldolase [Bacteroidota bacterium]